MNKKVEWLAVSFIALQQYVVCVFYAVPFSGQVQVLDEEIGRGGHATIYKGIDTTTGMVLAVKVVNAASQSKEDEVSHIAPSACLIATLLHCRWQMRWHSWHAWSILT